MQYKIGLDLPRRGKTIEPIVNVLSADDITYCGLMGV
jgi:hypothetical protein